MTGLSTAVWSFCMT